MGTDSEKEIMQAASQALENLGHDLAIESANIKMSRKELLHTPGSAKRRGLKTLDQNATSRSMVVTKPPNSLLQTEHRQRDDLQQVKMVKVKCDALATDMARESASRSATNEMLENMSASLDEAYKKQEHETNHATEQWNRSMSALISQQTASVQPNPSHIPVQ